MTRQVKHFNRDNVEMMVNSILATIDAVELELTSLKDFKQHDSKYALHLHGLKGDIVKEFYRWKEGTK